MKVTGERFIPGKMFKHSEIEHMHRYTSLNKVLSNKIVLDAACGTGYGSHMISSVAKKVYGIDISQEAINFANKNFGGNTNLEYIRGDITQLPFKNEIFDVVVSFETVEHINSDMQIRFLKEIKRVLKSDGILIMSTPNKEVYTDEEGNIVTEWHIKEFLEDEFKNYLHMEFANVNYYQQYMGKASFLLNNREKNISMLKYDKEKKGKFIIAIAGNGSANNMVDINSVYYFLDEYAAYDEICQIYYADSNSEFKEQNSDLIEVSSRNKEINIDMKLEESIRTNRIRIDPLTNSCAISNFIVKIFDAGGDKCSNQCIIMQIK